MDHETDDGEMLAAAGRDPARGRPGGTRSGFVALAGRPNVGKSTLVNAIVGHKIAIVSDKPQTTRRAIRGVCDASTPTQLVLVDLPGVQRPRDVLTGRMQRRVELELAESDAALFVLNGEEGVGPGDRFIAAAARQEPGAGDHRGQQVRPAGSHAHRAGADGRRRARRRRRDLPDLRAHGGRASGRSSSASAS